MEKENIKRLKKLNKQKKQKISIKINDNLNLCKYIVTTKYNNLTYGKFCNMDNCLKHKNKINNDCNIFAINLCKHIITQKSGNSNRTGQQCRDFTFTSINNKYCSSHIKRHSDINNYISRTFKVLFYPTKLQIKKLNKFFGDARKTYNICVEKNLFDKFNILRDKYVTNVEYDYLKETPKDIRAFALKEYLAGKKSNMTQKRDYRSKYKYKSKKNDQCITISKDAIDIKNEQIYIYKKSFDENGLKIRKRLYKKDKKLRKLLNGTINHDMKIMKTKLNKYYLIFCYDEEIKTKQIDKNNYIACDPGGRTFLTTYNNNKIMEIGKNINKLMYKACNEINKEKNKKKEIKKITKLRNRIYDLHYKSISKIIMSDVILIPKMNIRNMIKKKGNLNKKIKQPLVMLSHCKFIERLKNKCETTGNKLYVCCESYTSVTCGMCFNRNDKTKSKIFKCKFCNYETDRDINAARNIFLKNIDKL